METNISRGWVLEIDGGEEFIVEDLIQWCDENNYHPYLLYRTYDKSDMNMMYGKRYYKDTRLKARLCP